MAGQRLGVRVPSLLILHPKAWNSSSYTASPELLSNLTAINEMGLMYLPFRAVVRLKWNNAMGRNCAEERRQHVQRRKLAPRVWRQHTAGTRTQVPGLLVRGPSHCRGLPPWEL